MRNILIFCGLFLLTGCGGIDFSTYSNKEHGFEIDYPSSWDTTNMDVRMVFMALEGFKDSADQYTEGMSISVYDNEGNALSDIVDQNISIAQYYFTDAQIQRDEIHTTNDIEGIKLELTYDAQGLEVMNRACFFDHAGKLYTITQSVENAKRAEYEELFDQIINSLNWLD